MTTAVNPTPPPRLKQKLVFCFPPLGRETAGGLQSKGGCTCDSLGRQSECGHRSCKWQCFSALVIFPLLVLPAVRFLTAIHTLTSHSSLSPIILRSQKWKGAPNNNSQKTPREQGPLLTTIMLSEKQHPLGQLWGTGTKLRTALSDFSKEGRGFQGTWLFDQVGVEGLGEAPCQKLVAGQNCQEEVELNCLEKPHDFWAGGCDGTPSEVPTANPVPPPLPCISLLKPCEDAIALFFVGLGKTRSGKNFRDMVLTTEVRLSSSGLG